MRALANLITDLGRLFGAGLGLLYAIPHLQVHHPVCSKALAAACVASGITHPVITAVLYVGAGATAGMLAGWLLSTPLRAISL